MNYLDKRDNRDIIEKIRRRYLVKGIACAFLMIAILSFFLLYGYTAFTARMGSANAAIAWVLCMALPFFLLGLHRDLTDCSWEGKVMKREAHKVAKGVVKIQSSVEKYLRLSVKVGNDIRIVDGPADVMERFLRGDRIRHIRGTKHYQLYRPGREHTDCVMCGRAADRGTHTCPHCHFSLVKYDPPEEEAS